MDACWLWTGKTATGKYAGLHVGVKADGETIKRRISVHRLSYEAFKGPIPVGLEIDHLCRNKRCYNPDHLEAVTH